MPAAPDVSFHRSWMSGDAIGSPDIQDPQCTSTAQGSGAGYAQGGGGTGRERPGGVLADVGVVDRDGGLAAGVLPGRREADPVGVTDVRRADPPLVVVRDVVGEGERVPDLVGGDELTVDDGNTLTAELLRGGRGIGARARSEI